MIAVLYIAHGRTGIEVTVEVIGADALHESINVAVDRALTGDGKAVSILRVDKGVARLERYRAVNCRCAGHRSLACLDAVRVEVGCNVLVRFQYSALLEVQLDIALEHDGAGVKGMAAL